MRPASASVLGLVIAAAGCASVPPEQVQRDALLWDAARECEWRFTNIRVKEIDHLGRLVIQVRDTFADTKPFFACYEERAKAKLAAPAAKP